MRPKTLWRLGHRSSPASYPPRHLSSWNNRFDDPQRIFRTLYGAQTSITCLRELLADLRPNAEAIAEFDEVFSDPTSPSLAIAGVVSAQWRRLHVLVNAKIIYENGAGFIDLEKKATLEHLSQKHASLLAALKIRIFTINHMRSRERLITRQFSRTLYEDGYAGIVFRSRLDAQRCFALFEGRVSLRMLRKVIPMTENWRELVQVCGEYNLILRPV